jgi:hypothetical protein
MQTISYSFASSRQIQESEFHVMEELTPNGYWNFTAIVEDIRFHKMYIDDGSLRKQDLLAMFREYIQSELPKIFVNEA